MPDSPAAEHRATADDIRRMLQEAAPEWAGLPLARFAEGWDNALWRLGPDLLVRLPRRAVAAPLIVNEQHALPEVGPALTAIGIRTPVPVLVGHPTADFPWPWSVVPWIEGSTALGLPRSENSLWAPQLAEALRRVHIDAPRDVADNPVRGRPLRTRDDAMRDRRQTLAHHPALREAWSAGLSAPRADERVWVHGDLHPGNLLVEDGRLVALIDFGDVTAGDPAYDLASSWMLFDGAGREAFRAATDKRYDDATWVRARAWAAYIASVLLTQSDDRPDYRAVGASTAEAIEADQS